MRFSFLESDPEANIPKIVRWVEKFDRKGIYSAAYPYIEEIANDPDNIWVQLYKEPLHGHLIQACVKNIFRNFILNSAIAGFNRRAENEKKYNCNVAVGNTDGPYQLLQPSLRRMLGGRI